jgi:hypothetical protein
MRPIGAGLAGEMEFAGKVSIRTPNTFARFSLSNLRRTRDLARWCVIAYSRLCRRFSAQFGGKNINAPSCSSDCGSNKTAKRNLKTVILRSISCARTHCPFRHRSASWASARSACERDKNAFRKVRLR